MLVALRQLFNQIIQPRAHKVVGCIATTHSDALTAAEEYIKRSIIISHVNRWRLSMKDQERTASVVPSSCRHHPLPHQCSNGLHHAKVTVVTVDVVITKILPNETKRVHGAVIQLTEFLDKARPTVGARGRIGGTARPDRLHCPDASSPSARASEMIGW